MAMISDALRELKGTEVRIVYEFGGKYERLDGSTGDRREIRKDGVMEEVFDDHWIRVDGILFNIDKVIVIVPSD